MWRIVQSCYPRGEVREDRDAEKQDVEAVSNKILLVYNNTNNAYNNNDYDNSIL